MNLYKDRVSVVAVVYCVSISLQATRRVESMIRAKCSADYVVLCVILHLVQGVTEFHLLVVAFGFSLRTKCMEPDKGYFAVEVEVLVLVCSLNLGRVLALSI